MSALYLQPPGPRRGGRGRGGGLVASLLVHLPVGSLCMYICLFICSCIVYIISGTPAAEAGGASETPLRACFGRHCSCSSSATCLIRPPLFLCAFRRVHSLHDIISYPMLPCPILSYGTLAWHGMARHGIARHGTA